VPGACYSSGVVQRDGAGHPAPSSGRMDQMSERENRHTNREGSFDELAKGLAGGTVSRGKALRWLGAALFGGAVASIPGVALAKPKPGKCTKDKQCPAGQGCVDGQCVSSTPTCEPGAIFLPQSCNPGGTCACPTGFSCQPVSASISWCVSDIRCNDAANCPLGTTCCPGDPCCGSYSCCPEGTVCVNSGTNEMDCVSP
jgi:hypothetical protein